MSLSSFLRRQYWLLRILAMRIVDREYVEALSGDRFRSNRSAIDFYLRHETDGPSALSLSPLIEPSWVAEQVPDTDASWYVTLLRSRSLISTSPAFDPRLYATGERRGRPGTPRALRQFLATVTADTRMPMSSLSRGTAPTWSEYRASRLRAARLYREQLDARRPRTTPRWNSATEREFVAGLASVPAPSDPPLVSVVMATWNRAATIAAAVASVVAQSHTEWELIVIDDGSNDGTAEVLAKLASTDPRIRVEAGANEGVSAARNRGIASARGEFVAFLDSDNSWRPDFLKYCLAGATRVGAEFVYCAMAIERDDEIPRFRGIAGPMKQLLEAGNYLDVNAVVIGRRLLERVAGFDTAIRRWVDYDLFLRLAELTEAVFLPFIGVDYDDRSAAERITSTEASSWEDVVLGKRLIDWAELGSQAKRRVTGGVSVLIPTYGDWRLTADAVRSILDALPQSGADSRSVQVIVLDNGSRREVSAILDGLFGTTGLVTVHRTVRNLNFALGSNVAASLSDGEYLVMLNNDTRVSEGWLEPLISPLATDATVIGTQPLLVYPDGTIQTAGTVFIADDEPPRHFLSGHPNALAQRMPERDFSAVTAAAMAIRASDFIALHGFDPIFTNGLEDVDLCLRALVAHPGGGFRVIVDSVVTHREGSTPERGRAVLRNREFFAQRWNGSYPPSDRWRYEQMGLALGDG